MFAFFCLFFSFLLETIDVTKAGIAYRKPALSAIISPIGQSTQSPTPQQFDGKDERLSPDDFEEQDFEELTKGRRDAIRRRMAMERERRERLEQIGREAREELEQQEIEAEAGMPGFQPGNQPGLFAEGGEPEEERG